MMFCRLVVGPDENERALTKYILSIMVCLGVLTAFLCFSFSMSAETRPNIVFIVADDLGWNDVSFHGSHQIPTPNIDLLAYSGVALQRYYSHAQCTPSRSAILTGKFAHTIGMQGYPLTYSEDRGIPLTEKLLPDYLRDLGYSTHLVGKWHVGHSRHAYLPTARGYDTHFGHRGGYIDYYEYLGQEKVTTYNVAGLDLYRNVTADWNSEGYVTDLYNAEALNIIASHDASGPLFLTVSHNAPHGGLDGALLQAPADEVRTMRHIESPQRRIYAAIVKKLDDSVGDIVEALNEKGILNNTIIVFIADNGGAATGQSINYASNLPLRGSKFSAFEAGTRVVGLVWSANLTSNVWSGYIHAADWLPTIMGAVDGKIPEEIDGFNLWNNITHNTDSLRKEIFEIDDYTNYASIISGDYKLIRGAVPSIYSDFYNADLKVTIGSEPSYSDSMAASKVYGVLGSLGRSLDVNALSKQNYTVIDCGSKVYDKCYPTADKWCLYNIKEDPCEMEDLSANYTELAQTMLMRLQEEYKKRMPRTILYRDPRALPSNFNYTWTNFIDIGNYADS